MVSQSFRDEDGDRPDRARLDDDDNDADDDSVEYLQSVARRRSGFSPEESSKAGRSASTGKTGSTSRTSTTAASSGLTSRSSGASSAASSSHEYLSSYNERLEGRSELEKLELIPALAFRSYHLPNHNFCEDWFQYFANTHPLLGICCHHPLHPVKCPMRLLHLAGSIVFGLLVTNLIWLFLVYDDDRDADRAVVTVSLGISNGNTTSTGDGNSTTADGTGDTTIEVTEGMIFLWTLGGATHALFDNTIWFLTACVCCLPGHSMSALAGLKRYGTIFIVFLVVAIGAVSSFLVVFRAALSNDEETDVQDLDSAGLSDDQIDPLTGFGDKSSFQFLLSYAVEITLALFVWYPLVGTVLFTGVLGCGKVPVLGGRPYEVLQEQKRCERRDRRQRKKALRLALRDQQESLPPREIALENQVRQLTRVLEEHSQRPMSSSLMNPQSVREEVQHYDSLATHNTPPRRKRRRNGGDDDEGSDDDDLDCIDIPDEGEDPVYLHTPPRDERLTTCLVLPDNEEHRFPQSSSPRQKRVRFLYV